MKMKIIIEIINQPIPFIEEVGANLFFYYLNLNKIRNQKILIQSSKEKNL